MPGSEANTSLRRERFQSLNFLARTVALQPDLPPYRSVVRGKVLGGVGPQSVERRQVNLGDPVHEVPVLWVPEPRLLGSVLLKPAEEMGDGFLRDEHGGGLDERLFIQPGRSNHVPDLDASALALK